MRESSFLKPVAVPPRPDKTKKKPAKTPLEGSFLKPISTPPRPDKTLTSKIEELPSDLLIEDEDIIEIREPGELQEKSIAPAFEIRGFKGLEVAATLEKKDERKGDAANRNQDNIIADHETGLIGVLDGLGGEGQGDLASKSAERAIPAAYGEMIERIRSRKLANIIESLVEQQLNKVGTNDPLRQNEARRRITNMVEDAVSKDKQIGQKALALIEAVRAANKSVTETDGKTTACVGTIHEATDGTHWAVLANIGDSAAFLRKKNGDMIPLTQEDSLFNALSNGGALDEDLMEKLKAEPDKKFPIPVTLDVVKAAGGGEREFQKLKGSKLPMSYKKLKATMIAALGSESSEPSLVIRQLEPGDELIFGTDGLIDKFENPETEETDLASLTEETAKGKTSTERLDSLREAAKARTTYKKDDDIAIVSVKIPERK